MWRRIYTFSVLANAPLSPAPHPTRQKGPIYLLLPSFPFSIFLFLCPHVSYFLRFPPSCFSARIPLLLHIFFHLLKLYPLPRISILKARDRRVPPSPLVSHFSVTMVVFLDPSFCNFCLWVKLHIFLQFFSPQTQSRPLLGCFLPCHNCVSLVSPPPHNWNTHNL